MKTVAIATTPVLTNCYIVRVNIKLFELEVSHGRKEY